MSRIAVAAPLGVFLALAALFAVALLTGGGERAGDVPSALIGKPVPAFMAEALLPGVPGLSQADFAGATPVLLNVFASWCGPCRIEHPMLTRLAQRDDVRVFGLAYRDRPEDAAAFLNELGNPFARIGADPKGRAAIEWGVHGVPETFLVSPDGRILWKHVGELTPQIVNDRLLPLIASAGAP